MFQYKTAVRIFCSITLYIFFPNLFLKLLFIDVSKGEKDKKVFNLSLDIFIISLYVALHHWLVLSSEPNSTMSRTKSELASSPKSELPPSVAAIPQPKPKSASSPKSKLASYT